MIETAALMLCAVLAGVAATVQAGLNSTLRTYLGSPESAALVSFFIGTAALAGVVLAGRLPFALGTAIGRAPAWCWLGGFLGAFLVTVTVYAAPKLGAATMMALLVSGQMIASLILDHYGLIGFPLREASGLRIVGVFMLVGGVFLINRF